MKFITGCLLMLSIWIGCALYYWSLLSERSEYAIVVALLLGLSISFIAGQLFSFFQSVKKLTLSSRGMEEWQDGELVGISGPVRAQQQPVIAPASGLSAVIVEYELQRKVITRTSRSTQVSHRSDIEGFLMAPCGIQSQKGMIRLHGFPLLHSFSQKIYSDKESLERLAQTLASVAIEKPFDNIRSGLSQINSVLNDADGDILRHISTPNSKLLPLTDQSPADEIDSPAPTDTSPDTQTPMLNTFTLPLEHIQSVIASDAYQVAERVIAVGQEITVFGTYRQKERAINIGSGLTNLEHSIHLGSISSVARKGVLRSLLGIIFWGGSAWLANYAVLPEVRAWANTHLLEPYAPSLIEPLKKITIPVTYERTAESN